MPNCSSTTLPSWSRVPPQRSPPSTTWRAPLPAEQRRRPLLQLVSEWALLRYPTTITFNSSSPICTFHTTQKLFSGFQAFRFLLLFCFSIEYSSNNHRSSLSRIIKYYYSIFLIWTISQVLLRLAARVRLGRCSQQRHSTITHCSLITSPYFSTLPLIPHEVCARRFLLQAGQSSRVFCRRVPVATSLLGGRRDRPELQHQRLSGRSQISHASRAWISARLRRATREAGASRLQCASHQSLPVRRYCHWHPRGVRALLPLASGHGAQPYDPLHMFAVDLEYVQPPAASRSSTPCVWAKIQILLQ